MPQQVVYKQVIDLNTVPFFETIDFEVPAEAEVVDIQWDTRNPVGIGVWYQQNVPDPNGSNASDVQRWRFLVRGTGDPFPAGARHMCTVVRDGYAWHIFDADGENIEWAPS